MHVLLLPSWYSTADKPWRGTFFRADAMIAIVAAEFRPESMRGTIARRFGYGEIASRLCELYGHVAAQRREVA